MEHRVALVVAALALTACTARETKQADTAAPAAPNVVTITAKDFAFEAPDTIPAGVTTIRLVNQGPSLHHAQLLRFDQGKTLDDFLTAMKAGGPPPMWAIPVGGPNAAAPGTDSNVTEMLEAGSYAVVCFVDVPDHVPHVMKGMSHAFVVTPSSTMAPEPTPDVTLQLVDYTFTFAPALSAGKHVIRVDNAAQQPHEFVIAKLDSGKTLADMVKWAGTYKGPPPGMPMGGVAAIAPGTHAFVSLDLPAGDYVVMCFVSDAKDGKPHLEHGMAMQLKVS